MESHKKYRLFFYYIMEFHEWQPIKTTNNHLFLHFNFAFRLI